MTDWSFTKPYSTSRCSADTAVVWSKQNLSWTHRMIIVKKFTHRMDAEQQASVIGTVIVMLVLLLAQMTLLAATICILIYNIIKYIQLQRDRKRQQSQISNSEKMNFLRKVLFLLVAIPLPILAVVVEVWGVLFSVTSLYSIAAFQVFITLLVISSFFTSFYLIACLVYVSFVFLNIIKKVRNMPKSVYIFVAAVLILSLVVIALSHLFSIVVVALAFTNFNSLQTVLSTVVPLMVAAVSLDFWCSFWICTVVLILGMVFYFSIPQQAKKASMQIIIFLSVMVVSALIQSFGNLLGQLFTVHTIFVILFFAVQRFAEVIFMVGLVLLYAPLNSLGQVISKNIIKAANTAAENLANTIGIGKKKEEVTEVNKVELAEQPKNFSEEISEVPSSNEILTSVENSNATSITEKIM